MVLRLSLCFTLNVLSTSGDGFGRIPPASGREVALGLRWAKARSNSKNMQLSDSQVQVKEVQTRDQPRDLLIRSNIEEGCLEFKIRKGHGIRRGSLRARRLGFWEDQGLR